MIAGGASGDGGITIIAGEDPYLHLYHLVKSKVMMTGGQSRGESTHEEIVVMLLVIAAVHAGHRRLLLHHPVIIIAIMTVVVKMRGMMLVDVVTTVHVIRINTTEIDGRIEMEMMIITKEGEKCGPGAPLGIDIPSFLATTSCSSVLPCSNLLGTVVWHLEHAWILRPHNEIDVVRLAWVAFLIRAAQWDALVWLTHVATFVTCHVQHTGQGVIIGELPMLGVHVPEERVAQKLASA